MKVIFYFTIVTIFLCSSCKSKYEQAIDEGYELIEDYIGALENAKSKQEVKGIKKEFRRREKEYEEKVEEIVKQSDLEDVVKITHREQAKEKTKALFERAKQAERNADKRFER